MSVNCRGSKSNSWLEAKHLFAHWLPRGVPGFPSCLLPEPGGSHPSMGTGTLMVWDRPSVPIMFTCHCVAVTLTPRVELYVLGSCPCFAGGKLSPEMKKPLPHGGSSLQGRGSRCVLKPAQVGPLPQRQGNEGEQCPRSGPRGRGRGMIRALCTRERGRLRGVAACSRQRLPVSLLVARARPFRAWPFPLGARSNLELRFPSFIPLFLSSILCPGSGHTHVHL